MLHLEVRNAAIHRLERRGAVGVAALDERLSLLESEIRFHESSDAALLSCIVSRARTASLSIHDATYPETARRGGAALATRDAALLIAAREANVETFDLR